MQLNTMMLADGAHVADGKLYVLGGQWDRMTVAAFPARHPTMTVALVLQIEYTEAPKSYTLTVELTLDGRPEAVKAVARFAIGHAPVQARGAPQFAPIAIPFQNVPFRAPGRYEWVISVDDKELGRLPIEVTAGMIAGMPQASAEQPSDD